MQHGLANRRYGGLVRHQNDQHSQPGLDLQQRTYGYVSRGDHCASATQVVVMQLGNGDQHHDGEYD